MNIKRSRNILEGCMQVDKGRKHMAEHGNNFKLQLKTSERAENSGKL